MKKFIRNKKILLLFVLLGFFFIVSKTFALEIDWPKSPVSDTQLNDDSVLGDMVKYFYEWGITMGGLVTFFSLLIGGFKYLTSIGSPTVMKEATDQITSAFLGLILLLSSWLILNTISPQFTTFQANPFKKNPYGGEWGDFSFKQQPSCDYAILYDNSGNEIEIEGTTETELTEDLGIVHLKSSPVSIRAFRKEEEKDKECGPEACLCYVKLYADVDEGSCNFMVAEHFAYHNDLPSLIDPEYKPIKCIQLKAGGACRPCYKPDESGKCIWVGDTNWGEGLAECYGDNKRCFDKKCRTCEGWWDNDGLGGKGCWYKEKGGEAGHSCNNEICKDHGGCVDANWNDDENCTICRHFFGSDAGCIDDAHHHAPFWGNSWLKYPTPYCYYRTGEQGSYDQDCDSGIPKHSASWENWEWRICVCEY
ncbi:MAG: hypothetical protein IB617_00910 [Candidatus Nealsonbacteria bacterium]|nr:MAG: hypothetical protein IB617_00910 [Candidatus Nealsonbacteria bacterium]